MELIDFAYDPNNPSNERRLTCKRRRYFDVAFDSNTPSPYVENERQFLLLAVEVAVRTFQSLNAKPGDGFGGVSSTRTAQDGATPELLPAA